MGRVRGRGDALGYGVAGMTTRAHFLALMAERRKCLRGTADHEYRTRAARKLVWIMRGIPSSLWSMK